MQTPTQIRFGLQPARLWADSTVPHVRQNRYLSSYSPRSLVSGGESCLFGRPICKIESPLRKHGDKKCLKINIMSPQTSNSVIRQYRITLLIIRKSPKKLNPHKCIDYALQKAAPSQRIALQPRATFAKITHANDLPNESLSLGCIMSAALARQIR